MYVQDKTKNRKHDHIPPGFAWRTPAALAGLSLCSLTLAASALADAATINLTPTTKTDAAISRALTHPAGSGWVSVIFKTNAPLTSAQEAQMTALGADIVRRLPIIGSVTARVPERNLGKLAALPFAAHLSLDGGVQKTDAFTVGSSEANLATATVLSKNGKQSSTYQLTGAGVTVAVLDSGITPAADLSSQSNDFYNRAPSRLLASVNFSTALTILTPNGPGPAPALPGPGTAPLPSGPGNKSGTTGTIVLPLVGSSNNLYDPCGHGTHVAGIIAGNGSRSPFPYCTQTFNGIAPQANLVSVRVLDVNGASTVSTVISGLQWVLTNQKQYNIRVVNLSLGHPVGESYTTDPICQAVEALYKAGIVVVCAAGNDGRTNGTINTPGLDNEGWGTAYGTIQSPGNDPYVITVGATKSTDGIRSDDKIATYSSRGPSRLDLIMKPDIIAPGNKVISLDAHGSTLDTFAGGTNDLLLTSYVTPWAIMALNLNGSSADYFQLSGTSMASPVVAGAAALLLQANPALTPDTIKARLMLSADKWFAADGTEDPLTYGAGYLNIPAALASTVAATGPAVSPALTMDSSGNVSIVLSSSLWGGSLWGTGVTDLRAMWGSRAMWGCTSVDMTRAMWGSNTVFGANQSLLSSATPTASRAMWGCSVWGDSAIWGSSTTTVDLTSTTISGE